MYIYKILTKNYTVLIYKGRRYSKKTILLLDQFTRGYLQNVPNYFKKRYR